MPDDLTLMVHVDPDTHRRLSLIAAGLSIPKQDVYRMALVHAARAKVFKDLLKEVYAKPEGHK